MQQDIKLCIILALPNFLLGYEVTCKAYVQRDGFYFEHYILLENRVPLICSFVYLGAIFGCIINCVLYPYFGQCKPALISVTAKFIIIIVDFIIQRNFWILLLGRFLDGLAMSVVFTPLPIQRTHISRMANRALCGTIPQIFHALGVTFALIIPHVASIRIYEAVKLVALFTVVAAVCVTSSPLYFLRKSNNEKAKKALKEIREKNCDWQPEYDSLFKQATMEIFQDFRYIPRDQVIIILGCHILYQMTGATAMFCYTQRIFRTLGMKKSTYHLYVFSLFNVSGSVVAVVLSRILGRRPLLFISLSLCFFSNLVITVFAYYFKNPDWFVFPYLAICVLVFAFHIGIGPVSFIITSEIFSSIYEHIFLSVVAMINCVLGFLIIMCFPEMERRSGIVYTVISGLGIPFVYFCIFETKHLTLNEIEEIVSNIDIYYPVYKYSLVEG